MNLNLGRKKNSKLVKSVQFYYYDSFSSLWTDSAWENPNWNSTVGFNTYWHWLLLHVNFFFFVSCLWCVLISWLKMGIYTVQFVHCNNNSACHWVARGHWQEELSKTLIRLNHLHLICCLYWWDYEKVCSTPLQLSNGLIPIMECFNCVWAFKLMRILILGYMQL